MSNFFKEILPYIHNRWIIPSHKVIIRDKEYGIGRYHDPDYQLLFAAFQVLVDYVEIECASIRYDTFNTPQQKLYDLLYHIPGLDWFLPAPRNALQGLHYLRWSMKLTDHPSQAESARAIFKLYKFWKHDRPRRIDPWDYTDAEIDDTPIKELLKTPLSRRSSQRLRNAQELEDKYHEEDDEMLKLLMKYRRCMWV